MRTIRSILFGMLLGAVLALALKGRLPVSPPAATPAPTPTPAPATPTPPPEPTPPPTPYVPNKRVDIGKIFNGMRLRTTLQTENGTNATADRAVPENYSVDVDVHVKVPKPHHDLAEMSQLNPQIPLTLPQLPLLLETAKISPFYDDLYRLKVTSLQQSLMHLDGMLSRHNFFDCETVLELEHPLSKRRVLLMQADMDTDDDGSDSDRVPEVDGSSATFQPFTSYKWAKKTTQPNSFTVPRQSKMRLLEQELAMGGAVAGRAQQLRGQILALRQEISDLQKYSYLVGSVDPYVVLPASMFGKKFGAYAPSVGDYCVVLYGSTLFPAVIGDVGPSDLVGEASLRICREIDPRADANNRPVNDLKATYLIFPGSADHPFDAPNLDKWWTRCDALLKEIGGYHGQLMAWTDLTKPKPPPATPAPPSVPSTWSPVQAAPTSATPAAATPSSSNVTPSPATPAPATPKPAVTPAPAASPAPQASH